MLKRFLSNNHEVIIRDKIIIELALKEWPKRDLC